jgi:hypothetical protein
MDVEVWHSIAKSLNKLEILTACIKDIINPEDINVTEEMATMIAKRLPKLR